MRPWLLGSLLTVALLTGCAEEGPEPPVSRPTTAAQGRGLSVALPMGWQRSQASLTPSLGDPREVLSVGTFPLVYRETGCAHMPSSALKDLGSADAFVTLQERGTRAGAAQDGFPGRPARFGPQLGGSSEASQCARGTRFSDHWFTFSDGDRRFHVLVAFGAEAPDAIRVEAWAVLDSLRVDPGVRPDRPASG